MALLYSLTIKIMGSKGFERQKPLNENKNNEDRYVASLSMIGGTGSSAALNGQLGGVRSALGCDLMPNRWDMKITEDGHVQVVSPDRQVTIRSEKKIGECGEYQIEVVKDDSGAMHVRIVGEDGKIVCEESR